MNKILFRIKNPVLIILLSFMMCMLGGCAFMDSSFFVELSNEDISNKYIDILIPFETNDEFYTELNTFIDDNHQTIPSVDKNSEIAKYNEFGYRSMLVHYAGTNVFYSNSEYAHISLPDELYRAYTDPYGEEAFKNFCNKYKKCKFVIINEQGEILNISKEIKLKKFGHYLNGMTKWNIDNNKIKVSYHISSDSFAFYVICSIISIIGFLVNIILCKIHEIRCNKGKYKCYTILVISALITLFSIPIITESVISLFLNCELSACIIIAGSIIFIISFVNIMFIRFFFNDIVILVNRNARSFDKENKHTNLS